MDRDKPVPDEQPNTPLFMMPMSIGRTDSLPMSENEYTL
jgi:hypothetical protein